MNQTRQLPLIDKPGRSCGNCSLCCTLLGVTNIEKPAYQKCEYEVNNRCTIYNHRPEDCRSFSCMWLRGLISKDLKPNKIGAVLVAGEEFITIHTRTKGDEKKLRLKKYIEGLLSRGVSVVIVHKDERSAIGHFAELVQEEIAKHESKHKSEILGD